MSQLFLVAYLTGPGNYRRTSDLVDQFFILAGIQSHFSAMICSFSSGLYHANTSRVTAPLLRLPVHPWRIPSTVKDETEDGVGVVVLCAQFQATVTRANAATTSNPGPNNNRCPAPCFQHAGTGCQSASGTVACSRAHVSASPRQAVYRCTVGYTLQAAKGRKNPFLCSRTGPRL